MRAIRSDGRTIRVDRDVPTPEAREGEVVVRPLRLGVSGEDVRVARAPAAFTGVLGHEFVGVVEHAVGGSAAERLVGRRVVGSSLVACGRCPMCRGGLSTHCAARTVLGVLGRDGCFAERFVIPASNLVALPASVSDDAAVCAHSLGRVLHAMRMLRLEGKAYVSVLGDGALALLAAQAMAARNASVRLLGRHGSNLDLCGKWGVKHRGEHEAGRRHDQDVVFDCVGDASSVDLALGLVRPRGTLVLLNAPHDSPGAPDARRVVEHELVVLGSRGAAIGDAVVALASGAVDALSLVTRRFRFDDAIEAIRAAGEPGALKVLLDAA